MAHDGKLRTQWELLKAGDITRRQFIERATALGVGLPVIAYLLQAPSVAAAPSGGEPEGFARMQTGQPGVAPDSGTENQTRGEGDELRIILWQAPTVISPHVSTGTKDFLLAQFMLEPLMSFLPDASIVPTLAAEVPTIENGLLAEDYSTVTFRLREGVLWSDGEPFTASDVVFTWEWITNPANNSVTAELWGVIASIEATDDLTAVVTFTEPNPTGWYVPFTNYAAGPIYPRHVLEAASQEEANELHQAFTLAPTGTGPYVVESFTPNAQAILLLNENYREPNKPFFSTVNVVGGGTADSAARAVLQTGEFDYAWNLQVEPEVLANYEQGGAGTLVATPGTALERLHFNFSDPNTEVDGQRSHMGTPHPFLSDPAVRQALQRAVDKETIASRFYEGAEGGEPPATNVVNAIPALESPNTELNYNLEEANQILDDAGWVRGDNGVRAKDGVELSLTYSTSINSARQRTQAVVQSGWEEIGVEVRLTNVDAAIYFDSGVGNEQNISHFYADVQMYTSSAESPYPLNFMLGWYAGAEDAAESNIAQQENDWSGQNYSRYRNPDYDAAYEAAEVAADYETGAEFFIQMNDIIINDNAAVPQVNRAADKYAISNRLNNENVALGSFDGNFWNIANWNLAQE